MLKGNHCDALSINEKNDNTVTEGYISSEQLQQELKNAGKITTSYIESIKEKMSDKDVIALKEQINSEEFRNQLRKATEDSKEKIAEIYERNRLKTNLANIQKERERIYNDYVKNLEEYNKKVSEAEIKELKKIINDKEKTTQKS